MASPTVHGVEVVGLQAGFAYFDRGILEQPLLQKRGHSDDSKP